MHGETVEKKKNFILYRIFVCSFGKYISYRLRIRQRTVVIQRVVEQRYKLVFNTKSAPMPEVLAIGSMILFELPTVCTSA